MNMREKYDQQAQVNGWKSMAFRARLARFLRGPPVVTRWLASAKVYFREIRAMFASSCLLNKA